MMQPWFESAKFGIFIHWGAYAVGRRGKESWPVLRKGVAYNDYIAEMSAFDARDYNPSAWAELFKQAGAQYAVLTTKHHDGVTLWPTEEDSPSLAKQCGDLVGPFCDAIRQAGLHVGLYFSHCDWSHVAHMQALSGLERETIDAYRKVATDWTPLIGNLEQPRDEDPRYNEQSLQQWEEFLTFHRNQIKELLTSYDPVDLIWFDVMWGQGFYDYRCAELRDFIHHHSPNTVINSRMDGHGDYETPEQFIPVHAPKGPWELCVTTNDTWSYTGSEKEYKTPQQLLTMFCECLGMGGNMLLNVGPDEHGIIPEQQVSLLQTIGAWISRNEEAVYTTQRGLPHGYSYHFTSLNQKKDVIYLYLAHAQSTGPMTTSIKGVRNEIVSITALATNHQCAYHRIGGAPWLNVPGTLWIDIPDAARDPELTVLKIQLREPLDLHGGEGVEIDLN